MELRSIVDNIKKTAEFLKSYVPCFFPVIILIVSDLTFIFAGFLAESFNYVNNINSYLAWHNLFEFMSILISFSVFIIIYYTYDQSHNLRMLFIGNILLIIGIIDVFHTLSFKGMPHFFIPNDTANRATTLWIISRLIAGIGFIISRIIDINKKSNLNKRIFLFSSVFISLLIFIVATYFPQSLPLMYDEEKGLTKLKVFFEYIIMILFGITVVMSIIEHRKTQNYSTLLFAVSVTFNIPSEFAFISYYRVYDIYNYIGHIYKLIASFIIFRAMFIFNVQKPYFELSAAQAELKAYAENLDRIVYERTIKLTQMNKKFLEDLEYARDIQKSMLPETLPDESAVSFDARYFPSEKLSGDSYNIFKLDEDHIGMYIGDVAGHGVSAAMLTVFLNQNIKSVKETENGGFEINKPSDVLKNIYKSFNETNFKEEIYMVLLYAVYNIKTMELTYSSAGMNVSPIIIEKSGSIQEIDIKGFPIFKFIDFFHINYTDSIIRLNSGDKILFYTDGLIDAQNSDGERFMDIRLKNILYNCSYQPISVLSDTIAKNVFNFIGDKSLHDDITFFIMDIK